MGAFTRQFLALSWKNVLIFTNHPLLNIIRCFILPVAYGVFLAVAQIFLIKPDHLGIGAPEPIRPLREAYDGSFPLYYTSSPTTTSNNGQAPLKYPNLTPENIIQRISADFDEHQKAGLKKVDSAEDIPALCPQNFNGFSECFAAVVFNSFPVSLPSKNVSSPRSQSSLATRQSPSEQDPSTLAALQNAVNYTLRLDGGLFHIDVRPSSDSSGGKSDVQKRHMPLQQAIDAAVSAIILESSGTSASASRLSTPNEWPFTRQTNAEQANGIRLSYVRGIRNLLVLALFIAYIGIAYTLPGAYAGERASLLTAHLRASGLKDSARILSWHITHSLSYLPAWIIVALIWHYRIFSSTSALLILALHILLGLTLASWSLPIAAFFPSSPQLAAVVSTFLSLIGAILALVFQRASTGGAVLVSLIFPPASYVFALRAVSGWENNGLASNAVKADPDTGLAMLPIMIVMIIDIVAYPWIAVLLERRFYDAHEPRSSRTSVWGRIFRRSSAHASRSAAPGEEAERAIPEGTAISIRHLSKVYPPRRFPHRSSVTAVADLSFDVPRHGVFVLLGANGAGKSTTLGILAGLIGRTGGEVVFKDTQGGENGRPRRGDIGIVPQKNVLFDDLTCVQNLRVWAAVKRPEGGAVSTGTGGEDGIEDVEQLLKDCDLGHKMHAKAGTLSGGQKRRLQLAAGLVGGSSIMLVDECTSGVDPLSRRALWRILNRVRDSRTVVFTTHFLDEADLLADHIAVLAAPGKLVAQGTPVELKARHGGGYVLDLSFEQGAGVTRNISTVVERLRGVAPACRAADSDIVDSDATAKGEIVLGSQDPHVVKAALGILEDPALREELHIKEVDVRGASMEGVFLGLMEKEQSNETPRISEDTDKSGVTPAIDTELTPPILGDISASTSKPIPELTPGRPQSFLRQTLTIFHKRTLIARRAWLTPFLAIALAIAGACIPLVFLRKTTPSCVRRFSSSFAIPVFLPLSPEWASVADETLLPNGTMSDVYVSPPGTLGVLGPIVRNVTTFNVSDQNAFTGIINQRYRNLTLGGVSFEDTKALLAWEASSPGMTGPVMLNLANNVLLNRALNTPAEPVLLLAHHEPFPFTVGGTLVALKWVAFFGAAMAVYPAFFSMYVARERRSGVQAMQFSNGLANPAGLWLGHLMFDAICTLVAATVITIVFATAVHVFHGLGYLWLIMVLYGLAATLFAYCMSLVVSTPLAAFAATAGVQVVLFILYLAAYLLILTYAKTSDADSEITIVHFTMSLLTPVASVMRAAFVSVNLFSLLCQGDSPAQTNEMGDIMRFGGPIVYLIGQIIFYFAILVWKDAGAALRKVKKGKTQAAPAGLSDDSAEKRVRRDDVREEEVRVADSEDILKVMKVSKSFDGKRVVDDVSFGAERGTMLALLGPNGAGKTTTFNMIRGDIVPTTGQILIQGKSIVSQPHAARLSLGVCPQFTAIDAQLSVAEHLAVYGRLKGLRPGIELNRNVDAILTAAGLQAYANREASRLSGGNQRKLALAIALMGDPAVVLIDEFSSGVDARMKREMWGTLRAVAKGKAVVITTHSMEEASALANKVAILAKRMLAVGTTAELEARYATYEVHFSARAREDTLRAREIMARVPGARAADDVATRYEVPVHSTVSSGGTGSGISLGELFGLLAETDMEFAVERPMLESVFLKVIREHNVEEEERAASGRSVWATLKRWV